MEYITDLPRRIRKKLLTASDKIKERKDPGPDKIPPEIVKEHPDKILEILKYLLLT